MCLAWFVSLCFCVRAQGTNYSWSCPLDTDPGLTMRRKVGNVTFTTKTCDENREYCYSFDACVRYGFYCRILRQHCPRACGLCAELGCVCKQYTYYLKRLSNLVSMPFQEHYPRGATTTMYGIIKYHCGHHDFGKMHVPSFQIILLISTLFIKHGHDGCRSRATAQHGARRRRIALFAKQA